MKKTILLAVSFMLFSLIVVAQDEEEKEKRPFKENLFTGGSISLQFFNNTFMVGGSPVFGYSLTNWLDAGIVANYNYTSYNNYQDRNGNIIGDIRQTVYGGGGFLRLYPARFLFAQAQVEHNILKQKVIPINGGASYKLKGDAGSMLLGAGYTTGREGRGGNPFFYFALMFDVSGNSGSPYTNERGDAVPIFRGGLQIPLFQGQQGRRR